MLKASKLSNFILEAQIETEASGYFIHTAYSFPLEYAIREVKKNQETHIQSNVCLTYSTHIHLSKTEPLQER
jgi:hypothetical protein